MRPPEGRLVRIDPKEIFWKFFKKTLDFPNSICSNAIISLGAEEKTHREEERECVLFDSARFLNFITV